ncbi:hypothetical protein PpBr36_06836 [Pyricularia pennisetigena]|uniref:hypothetical protein n=1 Tax=Pyricularia pennisetigena TaxID=1578925 RepID=UPI00114F52F3|nr:hypothetical protein PpBr36_06836 [Pyricularia pennisetigena]TLS25298.1 hypothetical protein PpBr36_06836 [Pyricularia pennisetigena]
MEHLLSLVDSGLAPATSQQMTSTGHRRIMYGPNASRCASIEQHTVYKRVEELCLPPFYTRKVDYEEIGTIRPERSEFRKMERLPSNEIWVNTIIKISKAILHHPSARRPRGNAPPVSLPSLDLPFYSGYDKHETGQLLDQAMERIMEEREDNFFIPTMTDARATLRGVAAILYQHDMIIDVCKAQLPAYTADPPPPSSDADSCPTSRLDAIAIRMEESPLLNLRREVLPEMLRITIEHLLLHDYEIDVDMRIPNNTGITRQDLASFRVLLGDAIAFARTFPYAAIEARHLHTGFSTFVLEMNKFCSETWLQATVIFEDILHMFLAMKTAVYDNRYRPVVRDMVMAATARGDGEDEEPGVTNPERAMRATLALQRKLSVDYNVMVDFAVDDDMHKRLLLGVIQGVANMMSLPINASDVKPGPRRLLETGPEDTDDDLRKADPAKVSIQPAQILSLWELW